MKIRISLFFLGSILFSGLPMFAQLSAAKITFERKTNLYKKFKSNNNIQRWVKEEEKIKTDYFELYVTDTASVFKPQESDLKENYSWATSKNSKAAGNSR